jgi:hypothetical protein
MRRGLLTEAAQVVLPGGIVSTGFPATEATCRRIGIVFDPWQTDLNRCLLAKDAAGMYAADTVALSIPRQVGKTFDVGGVVFADSIINPGTTTVWTAHRFKVARESFNEMRGWAKSPRLRQHIDYDEITTAAGNECIPFRNGSRIVFAARERGAIRGFTKVRRLVLDEAQILTEHALSDLAPTQNQAVNPQLILMGTPPKPTDPGEVFRRLRTEALDGTSEGVLYVEFAAPKDSDPDDRDAWRIANPSYPRRTPEKAIIRLRKLLSEDDFKREALGIWDDRQARWQVISEPAWMAGLDPGSTIAGRLALAVTSQRPDRSWVAITGSGRSSSGRRHVEVIDHRPGTRWAVPRLKELVDKHQPVAVVVDDQQLADEAEQAGLTVYRPTAGDQVSAAGMLYAAVADPDPMQRDLVHLGQPELTDAVAGAGKRTVGQSLWAWERISVFDDVCPLVGASLALWAATTPRIHVARRMPMAAYA